MNWVELILLTHVSLWTMKLPSLLIIIDFYSIKLIFNKADLYWYNLFITDFYWLVLIFIGYNDFYWLKNIFNEYNFFRVEENLISTFLWCLFSCSLQVSVKCNYVVHVKCKELVDTNNSCKIIDFLICMLLYFVHILFCCL